VLIDQVVAVLRSIGAVEAVEVLPGAEERISFRMPAELMNA
jgi:hypothetical protein